MENKWAKWIIINGFVLGLGLVGEFLKFSAAWTAFVIVCWITVAVAVLGVLVMTQETHDKAKTQAAGFPIWLDTVYDLALVCLLIWHGDAITATAYFVQALIIVAVYGSFPDFGKQW